MEKLDNCISVDLIALLVMLTLLHLLLLIEALIYHGILFTLHKCEASHHFEQTIVEFLAAFARKLLDLIDLIGDRIERAFSLEALTN